MYKKINPLFLLCETPLHAGSGDDLGMVDLPIQRERHTSFPKIESSSLKGALREAFETRVNSQQFAAWHDDDVKIHRFFGFDDGSLENKSENNPKQRLTNVFGETTSFAGCLAFTDARILLFPVKSMKGVFGWITCLQVLNKLAGDLGIAGYQSLPELTAIQHIAQPRISHCLVSSKRVCIGNNVVLEEYAFEATEDPQVKALASALADKIFVGDTLTYWREQLKSNLILLNDDDFRDFSNQSTEVVTRIKIDNQTGTVQDGALFTEEYLPTDAVMYTLIMASDENSQRQRANSDEVMDFFASLLPPVFQLGGNASIGKGLLRTQLLTQ
jgi:CRISPR-associated protein Cmr4